MKEPVGVRRQSAVRDQEGNIRAHLRREAQELDGGGTPFAGWEVHHVKRSLANPDRSYVAQSDGWFGQLIQRSEDGGKTWVPTGNDFAYQSETGDHLYSVVGAMAGG